MKIIKPEEAYAYALKNYPIFPPDWNISPHFTWNEVFVNELKIDGVPEFKIFQEATKLSIELEKIRNLLGKSMSVDCWFRSMAHNLRVKAQGYKPAMHSAHLYGMAVDFNVAGMTPSQVRALLALWVKQGKIHVRIEANTDGWVHSDIGSVYLNNYKWGIFSPY